MKWSDRQLMMLREMGIRLWPAEPLPGPAGGEAAVIDEAAAVAVVEEPPAAHGLAQTLGSHVDAAMAELVAERDAQPRRQATRPSAPAPSLGGPVLPEADSRPDTAPRAAAGAVQAHWMFVGDADEPSGLPSGDKAGQLLDNMLLACGLDRKAGAAQPDKQVVLTHAANTTTRSTAGQPSPEEAAAYEQRLLQQIAAVQPKVVVAMGRIAALALLRSAEPLGKLRGRVHQAPGAPGTAVVVTYPPAYLLRNPQDKARAWEDLCLAMSVVKAPAG